MTRAVLITGADGGLGSALAKAFGDAGWVVIPAVREAPDASPEGSPIVVDLDILARDDAVLAAFSAEVRERLISEQADLKGVVNNAAVQRLGRLNQLSPSDVRETLHVNLVAPMLIARAFLAELEKHKGSVLNIGSVHAQATKPEFSAYAASKAGLHGLTRALAVDLGPSVRVNTLAPAATATPMLMEGFEGRKEAFEALEKVHPAGRIATPDEIARIAVWLASDEADFVTGATLYADGGVLSRLHDPV